MLAGSSTAQGLRHGWWCAQRLIHRSAALLVAAAYLASSPIQAAESADNHRLLEQEIVDRLARGQDVASLVERVTPRDASAARYRQDETALHTDKALTGLREKLQTISSKKVLGKEDVAPLLTAYDEFQANHLLLKAQFESTRARLDAEGAGSDIRKRLEDAELAYNARVAKVQALEGILERLRESSDQAKLLSNADFKKKALSDIRASLTSLDKHSNKSRTSILRASTLPYRQAQLASRAPVLTPTIQPSYRSTSDSTVQPQLADTADSIDAPLSDEIIQQAKDLEYDYIRIYEFVRNSIKTEWYTGGMKGAVDTLRQRSGNDVDQASLLIALFRASGLASRYVHGVVELPIEDVMNSLGLSEATQATTALTRSGVAFKPVIRGGRVAAVQVEHTWVVAHVPYTNYRGSVVDGSGKTWLPLAPSLKQYQWNPSTGVFRKAGVIADNLIGAYLSAPQSTDLLSALRKQVTDYIQVNAPEQTYEQQLGSRTIASLNIGLLPTSLPVTVVAVTGESATLADSHRQRVRIVARQGTGATDPIILDVTVPIAEVAGNRVTLSYLPATVDDQKIVNQFGGLDVTPAYLIKLRPQIKIDGKQRAVAQDSLGAGLDHRFELYVLGSSGSQRIEQTFVAGSYHAIGIAGQRPNARESSLEEQVNESSDPADTEYPAARILSWRALNYIDKWNRAEEELAGLLNVAVIRPMPAITIASNASRVDYVLGQPMKLQWQGVTLDAALRIAEPISAGTDTAAAKEWMRLSALQGSSLEHLLFERDFLVDSISADKGLGFARANGTPVYSITSANISTILPELTHPANVKSDMENWVRLGMSVEAPRDPIHYQAWQGSVWRVEDPKTGGAGYFIAGALAGGATAEDLADWPLQALADLLQSPNSIPSNPDPLAGAEVVKLTTTDGQTGKVGDKLSSPLAVMVRDSEGHPVKEAQVTFFATAGGGNFDGDPAAPGIQEVAGPITTTTNALGIAQVDFILGKHTIDNPVYVMANKDDTYPTRAGLNYIDVVVEARFNTLTSEPFTAIAHPRDPAKLQRTDPQPSIVGTGLWVDTIIVSVQDEFDNAVSNIPVTFSVGSTTALQCSKEPQPPHIDPALFDASTESSECPTNPLLGDCGSASRTVKSTVHGVYTGVISGRGLSSFSILASAQGVPDSSWPYSMPSACDDALQAMAMSTSLINDEGKLVNAAKVSSIFYWPIKVSLSVGNSKFGWTRADADSASFTVDNGGLSSGIIALGNGTYETIVTTGPAPGINGVTFTAINPGGRKRQDGSDWTYSSVINAVYGLDPKITKTESQGQDPGVIYLDDLGKSAFPVKVHYTVPPADYMSITTEVDFLKNGVWDDYAIVTERSGDGFVPLPRGAIYNLADKYEAQLVINRGSDAEVKSDLFRLRMRQQIFKNVSRQVRISQDVDFVNQRMCERGAQFSFTLTQPATVTLSFKELRSTIAKTLVSNQSFPQGEHSIDILPDDLSPGDYTFELKGVSELDGHEDIEQGTAVAEFRGTNELPVGQTLVKGVNVKSGHLTLSAEEFTLPGRGVPLSFSRNYSSSGSTTPGALGIGWTHNYESKVNITSCGEVIVNGMRFVIDDSQDNKDGKQGYTPLKGYHGTLTQNYADGSFDFYSKDGTHYHFRKMGNTSERYLDAIVDTNGNVTRLGYDPADLNEPKLITVQDSSGRALTFTYEIKNFIIIGVTRHKPSPVITKVSGPDGIELNFEYNEFGNLAKVAREGDSRIETYTYSKADSWALDRKLASSTNPIGGTTSYSYKEIMISTPKGDGTDLFKPDIIVDSVTEPEGGITRFQIDPAGNNSPTTVTDPRGKATIYTMNGYGSVVSIQDPVSTTTMTWAPDDIVMTSKTDGRGVTTDYTYDSNGNVLSEKTGSYTTQYTYKTFTSRPIKNRVETVKDRNGNTTTNSYDERGNLKKVTNPEGGVVEHSYAANGDRLYSKDPKGGTTRYTYDAYGNVDTVTNALSGVTHTAYDERSRLIESTDPLGRKSRFAYDTLGRLITKTDAKGGVHSFTYDPAGNKLTETDANSHTTTSTYDRENRVKTITNALGDVKGFGYDAAGNKISESDWRANTTAFAYDDANRLVTRTEPLGRIARFGYDEVGNVTSETDPLNRVTRYEYDRLNRRTKITDALTNVTALTYDGINKTGETDALGRVTSYVYDKNNRLTTKTEPLGRISRFEYDANGNRTTETDPNGNIRKLVYDDLNRVVRKIDAHDNTTNISYDAVGNVVTEINPRLAQTRHEYDELNRRIKTIDPAGMATQFSYDSVGNRTGELWANGNSLVHSYDALNRLKTTTDALGAVAAYNYDANGNRTQETDARGSTAIHTFDELNRLTQSLLPEARTVKFDYDLAGNKISETDANNNVTAFGYDALNRLTAVTDPFAKTISTTYDAVGNKRTETDKRNHTTSFEYDALNRLVKSTDPLNQSVSFSYDANGNKLSETDKRGTTTSHTYDKENRLLSTSKGGLILVRYEYDKVGNKEFEHDALNNKIAYIYDLRNLLTTESRLHAAITHFKYDAMGDRIEVRDPEARVSTFTYDLRRRLQSESNGAGESSRYTYDGNGNRLTQKRPLGNSWSYSYDTANRLTVITDPLGGTTGYSYDKNGNRLSQTDANSHTTRYEYDPLNRQTAMVYADAARAEFSYDANGNRTGLIDPKQQSFIYSYDELNRETSRSYPVPLPASDDHILTITTAYDANSNVTGVSEGYSGATGTRITSKSYDIFDRLLSVTDAFGKTIKYQYDANGNRTRLTDPDNNVTQYSFDALNRLVGVMNGGGATSYEYDRSSLKTKVSYPNGTQALQSYDRAMRVSTIENRQNSAIVSSYQYQYDTNGNRTQQIETNGGAAETTTYTFDGNDRLTEVAYPAKTTSYSYDAAYNRLTERSLDNAGQVLLDDKSYHYNSRNQLTSITDHKDSAQSVSYSFDANGNQTLKSKNGVVTTFIYDVRDQLISVQENATTLGMFYYDYQGMRVAKDMGGQIVRYSYDGKSVLTQSDINGQTIAKYEYGPDQLLSMQHVAEGRQFYLFDALGSVSNLTNTSGLVQARYQYDAFGNLRAEAGSSFNRFTFTGHEKDTETGLYYFKARFYDPDTGRFLNQDPYLGEINTPPSLHRYLYAYANPVVYVDLYGYESVFKDAAIQLDDAKEYLTEREKQYGDGTALGVTGGIATATSKFALSLGQGLLSGLDYVANGFQQIAGTVTDADYSASARDIENTHKAIGNAIDYVLDGGLVKSAHKIADNATVAVTEGKIEAVSSTAETVWGLLTFREFTKGKNGAPKLAVEKSAGPGSDLTYIKTQERWYDESFGGIKAQPSASSFGPDSVGAARVKGSVVKQETEKVHGNRLDSTNPNHVYVIVDTQTGKMMKPGVSGQPLNKNGTSPRANKQLSKLNESQPDRYKAVVVEKNVARTDALEIEQMITDKHAARNHGAMPSPVHKKPQPQVQSREEFIDMYGFPDNRKKGGRY